MTIEGNVFFGIGTFSDVSVSRVWDYKGHHAILFHLHKNLKNILIVYDKEGYEIEQFNFDIRYLAVIYDWFTDWVDQNERWKKYKESEFKKAKENNTWIS